MKNGIHIEIQNGCQIDYENANIFGYRHLNYLIEIAKYAIEK